MSVTQLNSHQIGSVQRNDFDITTTGQAVITKVIAGTGMSISSTGVDAGTGDVTINTTGLTNPMTTLGDIIYGGTSGAVTQLAGNTSSTKQFLGSTGASGAATAPAWGVLAAGDIPNLPASILTSGLVSASRGGTNNAFTQFSGPSGLIKTFTLPNVASTILTTNAAVTIAQGGTGQTSNTAAFDALSSMTTLGDIIYGGTSGTGTRLAGSVTNTKQYLTSTSSSSVAAAPAWAYIVAADVPSLATSIITSGIFASTYGGTGNGFTKFSGPASSEKTFTLPNASCTVLTDNALVTSAQGGTGNGFTKFSGPASSEKTFTLPNASTTILTTNAAVTVAQGGSGAASFTAYSVICGGTTSTGALQNVSGVGSSGNVLTSNGASALPTWQAGTVANPLSAVEQTIDNGSSNSSELSYSVALRLLANSGNGVTLLLDSRTASNPVVGIVLVGYPSSSATPWFIGTNNDGNLRIAPMATVDSTGYTDAKDGTVGLTVDWSTGVPTWA